MLLILEREGRRGRKREREKHQYERETSVTSSMHLTWGLTHNPGMCPDWELNPQYFGIWDDITINRASWPGLSLHTFNNVEGDQCHF